MTRPEPTGLTPGRARIALAGLLLLLIAGVTRPIPEARPTSPTGGDVGLFEAVLGRLQAGQPYYKAMGTELRSRGYPTASVFNWRTPFPLKTVADLPTLTKACFFALGMLTIIGTLALVVKEHPAVMLIAFLGQLAVTIPLLTVAQYALMGEAWSGYLIMASVLAYSARWWQVGAVSGVLALLARELAAPYCLVCGVMAIRHRRWRETAIWTTGAIVFLTYLAIHLAQVNGQLGPEEVAQKRSWIQFGGLPFVLRIITFSGWYDLLPLWSRAVGCVLLVAAVWALRIPPHLRAAVLTYLVFFSVVGQSFNQYWGLVSGPIFALATGYGVSGLWRLSVNAWRRPLPAVP